MARSPIRVTTAWTLVLLVSLFLIIYIHSTAPLSADPATPTAVPPWACWQQHHLGAFMTIILLGLLALGRWLIWRRRRQIILVIQAC